MAWDYQREEQTFKKIPEGTYRVRIDDAEMTQSKAGNDMIKLTIAVSGQSRTVWDYIVFMPDNPSITNAKLTAIYDSFGIPDGNMKLSDWAGKVGAAKVKHDGDYEKIHFYLSRDKASSLPAWVEGRTQAPGKSALDMLDDEVPF